MTPGSDDSTEYWRAKKQARQEKRASNRENSAKYLRECGARFTEKNFGAHLVVEGREHAIDFWPGTGRWHCRSGKKGFGVRNLIKYLEAGG